LSCALDLINHLKQRNAEIFFGHNELALEKIETIVDAIKTGDFDLENKEFLNRQIPGQINLNHRNQGLGSGCLIDACLLPDVDLVIDLLVQLLLGNGISIVAGNEKIYSFWDKLVRLAYQYGFSNYNLSLSLMSEHELGEFISKNDFHFLILGKFNASIYLKDKIFNRDFTTHMIRVFNVDQMGQQTIQEKITEYTYCRAMAINTMRHGAPLDTGL
jgi:hypothetical protein